MLGDIGDELELVLFDRDHIVDQVQHSRQDHWICRIDSSGRGSGHGTPVNLNWRLRQFGCRRYVDSEGRSGNANRVAGSGSLSSLARMASSRFRRGFRGGAWFISELGVSGKAEGVLVAAIAPIPFRPVWR